MINYTNYISLGYFCSVAEELEKRGLRSASYPFDWTISDFEGVINAIKNNFSQFLDYEYLYQNSKNHSHYRDKLYKISFFHDFNKYKALSTQLKEVTNKYSRRIDRFYSSIKEPTLFIRYISDETKDNSGKSVELKYIEENYETIIQLLKSFNPDNNIVFIANSNVKSELITIYNVEPDPNDVVARKPFEKNNEFLSFINQFQFESKEQNIIRYNNKIKKGSSLKSVGKNR